MERQNLEARAEALQAELDLLKQRMARYEDEPTAE
jgi:prefoldin subunit 5